MSRRPIRTSSALALVALAGLALTACSSDDASPRPTSTPTSELSTVTYNECVDGAANIYLEGDEKTYALPEACEGVNVITSDATITLADVSTLVVEGDGNTVTVDTPSVVAFQGSNNSVTYTGDAPQVDDLGEGNTVQAAG